MKTLSRIFKIKIRDMSFTVSVDSAYISENTYGKDVYKPTINGRHYHVWHEIFIIGEEPMGLYYGDGERQYQNCILIVPPFVEHCALRNGDYRIMVSCKGDGSKFADSFIHAEKPFVLPLNYCVIGYAQTIEKHFFDMEEYSEEVIELLLKLILLEALSAQSKGMKSNTITIDSYLAKLENILFDYQNDINLGVLAREFGLSTKQTSRIIRKNYGTTLSDMVRRKRLDVACALLKNTDMAISEIVTHINFPSESAFYGQFKKTYGITPLHYRKEARAADAVIKEI